MACVKLKAICTSSPQCFHENNRGKSRNQDTLRGTPFWLQVYPSFQQLRGVWFEPWICTRKRAAKTKLHERQIEKSLRPPPSLLLRYFGSLYTPCLFLHPCGRALIAKHKNIHMIHILEWPGNDSDTCQQLPTQ